MLTRSYATPPVVYLPRGLVAVATFACLLTASADVAAQPARVFIDVNGGTQVSTTDFANNVSFIEFVEAGDLTARHRIDTGPMLDVSGGFVLGRGLAIGLGFTRFDTRHDAGVEARVPHPFFFDRRRSVSGVAPDLTRQEQAVHLQLRWFTPLPGPIQLAVFAGPSFFSVEQDLVTAVSVTQSFPFDTANFASAATRRHSESKTGYHVGADVAVFFSRYVGIGGLVRVSRATVDFTSEDGEPVSVDVGGVQVGGGLRVRF